MIKLLLRRGASPDASQVPFPAIHHAMLADDKPLMVALLSAGGDPNGRLAPQVRLLSLLLVRGRLPVLVAAPVLALSKVSDLFSHLGLYQTTSVHIKPSVSYW